MAGVEKNGLKRHRYIEVDSSPGANIFLADQAMDISPERAPLPSFVLKRNLSPQSPNDDVNMETSPLKAKADRLPKKKAKIEAFNSLPSLYKKNSENEVLDSLPSVTGREIRTPTKLHVDKAAIKARTPVMVRFNKVQRQAIKSVKSKTYRIANSAHIAKGKSPPGLEPYQTQPRSPRKTKVSAITSAPEPHYISVDQSRAITAARSNVMDLVKSTWPDSDEDKVTRSRIIDYDNAAHWTRLLSCHTLDIYKFFDRQPNDYSPHKYRLDDARVDVRYLGHPLDRERDIRARQFVVLWKTDVKRMPTDSSLVVFQVTFRCAKNCTECPDSGAECNEADGSIEGGGAKGKGNGKRGRPKKYKRECNVLLIVQVRAGDLSTCIIYRKFNHGPSPSGELEHSHFYRQAILEYGRMHGYTAAKIKRKINKAYLLTSVPLARQHDEDDISNIVQNIRRSERIDSDPMKCLAIFARYNKESVFHFHFDTTTDPPSNFATGLKNDFALQSLILYSGTNGCGLDSCYRLKNENRAPLTFLTTVNSEQHMLPGTVYLSSDIRATSIGEFLFYSRLQVEKHARDLVSGNVQVATGHRDVSDQLLAEARKIVAQQVWTPAFIMIDKCRANLNGIRSGQWTYVHRKALSDEFQYPVWPNIAIRICQFHIIQAIVRWDQDSKTKKKRVPLTIGQKYLLLRAFRELERCSSREMWDSVSVPQFEARLDVVLEGSAASRGDVLEYFRVNWFTEAWLECWTDIGLPPAQYREGHWSTNNWVERAFKTFDQVFLESRANKSIFRLVLIIVNEWFPYYERWQNKKKRTDPAEKRRRDDAWRIWTTDGTITECPTLSNGTRRWQVVEVPFGPLKFDNIGRL